MKQLELNLNMCEQGPLYVVTVKGQDPVATYDRELAQTMLNLYGADATLDIA